MNTHVCTVSAPDPTARGRVRSNARRGARVTQIYEDASRTEQLVSARNETGLR